MSNFFRLLDGYAALVYLVLAIAGMFAFRHMWYAWRAWRDAIYSLEREFSLKELGRATAIGLAILLLFFAEFFVSNFVVPALPAEIIEYTPTLDLFPPTGTENTGSVLVATSVPQTGMNGCVQAQKMISDPLPGDEVNGVVSLQGTADIPNFGFYKYEASVAGTSNWITISAGDQAVREAELGKWDTTTLANGDYFLRLVIVDNVGNAIDPCVISVRVFNQQ